MSRLERGASYRDSVNVTPTSSSDVDTLRPGTVRNPSLHNLSTPDLFSLRNRGIIVTGGAGGLGLAMAIAAIEAHAPIVYCLDIQTAPVQHEWARASLAAAKRGSSIQYHRVDVTDENAINRVIKDIYENSPFPLGGFFGSAGIIHQIPALDYPLDSFRRVLDVNTTESLEGNLTSGAFLSMRAVAGEMIKRDIRGSIVIVASISGSVTNRGQNTIAYNTSKGACLQLCRSAAAEWGPYGIRVNTLSPGYIKTAITDQLLNERPELADEMLCSNMLKRISTPDEFRGPTLFLLSQASSFMTGSDLIVDGGHTAY